MAFSILNLLHVVFKCKPVIFKVEFLSENCGSLYFSFRHYFYYSFIILNKQQISGNKILVCMPDMFRLNFPDGAGSL